MKASLKLKKSESKKNIVRMKDKNTNKFSSIIKELEQKIIDKNKLEIKNTPIETQKEQIKLQNPYEEKKVPEEKSKWKKIFYLRSIFSKKNKLNSDLSDEEQHKEHLLKKSSRHMSSKFDKTKIIDKRRIEKILDESLEKAGHEIRGMEFNKKAKKISVYSGAIFAILLAYIFQMTTYNPPTLIIFLFLAFISCSAVLYILILVGSFIILDYASFNRTREIEEVLPEFLQLASANISAGMPIDRALWFAVRPKFGVLAKEMEEVAKATMAGEDLEIALENFTKKYDSKSLKESMNLLIEGMRAGGEIGFLLNQIASNMQDIKIMKKEIAASVMSYVIFITVAAIVGAPFLLALSAQLLVIMSSMTSSMQVEGSSSSTFSVDMSSDSIDINDFRAFAVITIIVTSIFSAMIISAIRKGNTSDSIKVIPGFIAVSLLIFFAASALFGMMLGGFFT